MATSVWRGYITFGLVSIPVRLYRAARPDRVKLREVYRVATEVASEPDELPDEIPPLRPGPVLAERRNAVEEAKEQPIAVAPVRRVATDNAGGQIAQSAVVKGYEVGKDQFVTLDREELKALVPKTTTTMELVEFVTLASVDPLYFETSYYVQPEPVGEKPYALLYRSLKETNLVGVAQIAMHRREHIVIVRGGKSGLIAHTMYFSSEVRADQEHKADEALVNPKELELANSLVGALRAEFAPEKYRDNYRDQLEKLIDAKIAGQPIAPAQSVTPAKPAADIMEALRNSLAAMKKPPAATTASPVDSRRRKGG